MKKFFSLMLIVSIVSAQNINSAPFISLPSLPSIPWKSLWPKRASQSASEIPQKKTPLASESPAPKQAGHSTLKNAPKAVFTTIKSAIANHPYIALVVTVVAADQAARIYSKYYRENLAPKLSFGEKRKIVAPRAKRQKDTSFIE